MATSTAFQNAVRSGVSHGKVALSPSGNIMVPGKRGNLFINEWKFYKPEDVFNDAPAEVVFKGQLAGKPKLKIPIPNVKRTASFAADAGFFIISSRGYHTMFAPWHYFYFEKFEVEEVRGYQKVIREKFVSKLDSEMCFFTEGEKTEDIPELKDKAIDYYLEKGRLQDKLLENESKLDEIDPKRTLQKEYQEIQDRLQGIFKNKDGSTVSSTY